MSSAPVDTKLGNQPMSYITEGQVRASHRPAPAGDAAAATWGHGERVSERVGHFEEVTRTFSRADMVPLARGTTSTVEFMLEPIAYALLPGHQLRLSLAGTDTDNFLLENIPGLAKSWRVHTGGRSSLHLPVQLEGGRARH